MAATERFLVERGIGAPLMVVRGDGALVSAAFARSRPIETILSGPAASLVGARCLTGLDNAIVADIGGTTTDVAVLEGGRPRLDPEGAQVGGLRTLVEAVAMRTFGLGGDSEVAFDGDRLQLGPRRLVPLSLAAAVHGDAILEVLAKQSRAARAEPTHARFAQRVGLPDTFAAGLKAAEAALLATLTMIPQPLDGLLATPARRPALARLVARGLARVVGFTPSDAAHVLGRQANGNVEAARLGAALIARQKDALGRPRAASPDELATLVLAALTRASAEAILETAFAEDGLDGPAMIAHALTRRAIDGAKGVARLSVALDRPVVGVGAAARLHYVGLPALVGAPCLTPEDGDVANALGAVVGQVSARVEANVSQPAEGLFRVCVGEDTRDFRDEDEAMAFAESRAREDAARRASAAGTDAAEVRVERESRAALVERRRMFIDATVTATATGRPRIAGPAAARSTND